MLSSFPWMEILPFLMSGLALFLFGANLLSEELEKIGKTGAENALNKYTKHPVAAMASGVALTTILDSSSLVIVLLITAVNAGLIQVWSSFFVILGSNIGTTIGSQIIALDIGKWSWILLIVGIILILIKQKRLNSTGYILMAIGLILFGLYLVEEATMPLRKHEGTINFLKNLNNPIYGALIGAMVTVLIQSSSATVGIAIVLCGQQLIGLEAGIAVMMGAEIGTCADTLLVTLGKSKAAVKVGLFHFLFNVLSVVLGLLLIIPFTELVQYISQGNSEKQTLANAHLIFNGVGVLIAFPVLLLVRRFIGKENLKTH